MHRARILLLATLLIIALACAADAHSWYPQACCGGQHCMPADRIETDAGGDMIVVTGPHRVRVPRGFLSGASPDGRIHICFEYVMDDRDGSSVPLPFCLFLPAEG
jgi:hypothetical protein